MANSKKIEAVVSAPQIRHSKFDLEQIRQAKARKFKTLKSYGVAHISSRELQATYGCKRIGKHIKAGITDDCAFYMRDASTVLVINKCEGGYMLVLDGATTTKN